MIFFSSHESNPLYIKLLVIANGFAFRRYSAESDFVAEIGVEIF